MNDSDFVMKHIGSNEPICHFDLFILGNVNVRCLSNKELEPFELVSKAITPTLSIDVLKQVLMPYEVFRIALDMKRQMQQFSPKVALQTNAEFAALKKRINAGLNDVPIEVAKARLANNAFEYFGTPISKLSDTRVFIWSELCRRNKD